MSVGGALPSPAGGLRWTTAGESHGPVLIAILEGLPAGLPLDLEAVQVGMRRRWGAPGRGPRGDFERDPLHLLAGMKHGVTLGTPLALSIGNGDTRIDELPNLDCPRPGHADLPGVLRHRNRDVRAVLERASARETAARTALGEVAQQLLAFFGIQVRSWVLAIGGVRGPEPSDEAPPPPRDPASRFGGWDASSDEAWEARIAAAREDGDSLGGLFEVRAWGCPPGLGGYAQAVDRLDARLMAAVASIPAIRGVEIGAGFGGAGIPGSRFHDPIQPDPAAWAGVGRSGNHAGGVEGGLSNGRPIVLRAAMKPLPTLRRGHPSVALSTLRPSRATYERSDVCSVPAAAVVGAEVVALELASALRARLGGVTLREMRERAAALGGDQDPRDWGADLASDSAGMSPGEDVPLPDR